MTPKGIEALTNPTPQDKIVDFATDIVDRNLHTTNNWGVLYHSAVFYMSLQDNGEEYPSLKVSVPNEVFAEANDWRANFIFGFRGNTQKSYFVTVWNDNSVVRSYYNGREPSRLSPDEVEHFLSELRQMEPSLIPEISS